MDVVAERTDAVVGAVGPEAHKSRPRSRSTKPIEWQWRAQREVTLLSCAVAVRRGGRPAGEWYYRHHISSRPSPGVFRRMDRLQSSETYGFIATYRRGL